MAMKKFDLLRILIVSTILFVFILGCKKGQKEIAKTIYNSIVDYREYYDKQLKEDE